MAGDGRAVVRESFAEALGGVLGDPVEIVALADYDALGDALVRGDVDFAWLPPAVYVAIESSGVELLLACARVAGASYRAALFARADSSIRAPTDLWGTRVAWVHERSAAGYLFPRMELKIQGLKPDEVFDEQHVLGSHGAVVRAVALGEADVGATYVTIDAGGRPVRRGWESEVASDAMRAVLLTEPIPSDVVCAAAGVDKGRRAALTDALMALHDTAAGRRALASFFGAERLEATLPSHYDAIRAAYR